MFRDWSGVHLDVWVLLLMSLEVHLQVATGRETVATNIALEWSLSCNDMNKSKPSLLYAIFLIFPKPFH